MEAFVYGLARGLVRCLQALPLVWVAKIGRGLGAAAYALDGAHRNVTLANLRRCLKPEKTDREIVAIAKEHFRRLGENLAASVKTATMTWEELRGHLEFTGTDALLAMLRQEPARPVVVAIGHFGNFELYARFGHLLPGLRCATTYRALRNAGLDRLLQDLRSKTGCEYFERRFDADALKHFMNQPGVILGLLADQHAGRAGLRLPFLGHDCSTSAAPAVFALRYGCALFTAVCYRVGLAQWRIEAGAEVPLRVEGRARSTHDIMLEVNQAFEAAVRRDPANWFWAHKRWKPLKTGPRPSSAPREEE